MKRLCELYIRRAGWIGAGFCAVPSLVTFTVALLSIPFRGVYVLRVALCVVFGSAIAAYLNRYGVDVWLRKHRSADGPATIADGALVGAAIGIGSALLPTLTVFIRTSDAGIAKTLVICTYLTVTLVGALIGAVLASVGRKHVDRTLAAAE